MKKRLLTFLLCTVLLFSLLSCPAAAVRVVASPQTLTVNGTDAACEAYNIDGSNYFKLRDIAWLLRNTSARFSVDWDAAKNTAAVVSGGDYRAVGGETDRSGGDRSASAVESSQTILINGTAVDTIPVYNIGGNNFFRLRDLGTALGFGVSYDAETNTAEISTESGSGTDPGLVVHYLDVGQGDAALVECGGMTMLIDGGEISASSTVYAYLKAQGVTTLDYVVATHAHADHVGGIAGALNLCTVGTVFCPQTENDSFAFNNMMKYLDRQGVSITQPEPGTTFRLGAAVVTLLAPLREYGDLNNDSIVLRITYGDTAFLFAADAAAEAEADLLASGQTLSATVLKVGHHGSRSSGTEAFLDAVGASYAVISVGKDNDYGLPSDETLLRLQGTGAKLFRTDLQGTIVCESDGKTLHFTTERNLTAETYVFSAPAGNPAAFYIGNINSHVFHRDTCASLPLEKNSVYFATREEALAAGYRPCGNCNP